MRALGDRRSRGATRRASRPSSINISETSADSLVVTSLCRFAPWYHSARQCRAALRSVANVRADYLRSEARARLPCAHREDDANDDARHCSVLLREVCPHCQRHQHEHHHPDGSRNGVCREGHVHVTARRAFFSRGYARKLSDRARGTSRR